ncbi:18S rRNA maturation protein [Arachnomyces sp. PD_36]|nr:18S rRNA maturation protein [Arachnomyces sp. PD_36]
MASYRPNHSNRPSGNSDRRSRPTSHRSHDRREESPRDRDRDRDRGRYDHYEPRPYRDRRDPDPHPSYSSRQHRPQNRHHHQRAQDDDDANAEEKPKPKPRAYPRSQEHADTLASKSSTHRAQIAASNKHNTSTKNFPSINELKTKIRDVKRLLRHGESEGGLPADQRIEKERALMGYQRDLEEVEARKKRSEMISKYHFVRFLERKRATQALNRALHHLDSLTTHLPPDTSPPSDATLSAAHSAVHTARVSLNYTIYHPLSEKYISLYPNNTAAHDAQKAATEGEQERGARGGRGKGKKFRDPSRNEMLDTGEGGLMLRNASGERPPIWGVVERCMLEDEREGGGWKRRLEELRDGKVDVGVLGGKGKGKKEGEGEGGGVGGGVSLPVLGGKKKPGSFGVVSMSVGGKKPGSFGVGGGGGGIAAAKVDGKNKKVADVEMKDDDGEESDGGFFEL